MNFYYEVNYNFPCKRYQRRDKRKLKTKKQRIKFVYLMFAADKLNYVISLKHMEFVSSNHLQAPKHMFSIGDNIYFLNLVGAKGRFHKNKFIKEE